MSRNTLIASPTCKGSGASIYEWANSHRPSGDGLVPCPVCGKRVQVAKGGVMPRHNRALGRRLIVIAKDGGSQ